MDDVSKYNIDRWAALARANAVFTRPRLDLTAQDTQALVDPEQRLGEIAGRQVLCLAGGGGQQSVAFALVGAQVTVLDLSAAQLEQDTQAAAHYDLSLEVIQGDMRDLSSLARASFDIVYQPYSLNFVPDARVVFREVARVIKPGGDYVFYCANPFTLGLRAQDWDGNGYPISRPYQAGAEITYPDEAWVFGDDQPPELISGPREYRHTLSALVNGLAEQGFTLRHLQEEFLGEPDASAAPGSHEHFSACAPPWLSFWTVYRGR